jgi:aspartyl-tRNA(Asn)/glutamyl-tRNA(Gln) amidotransferase subunit B
LQKQQKLKTQDEKRAKDKIEADKKKAENKALQKIEADKRKDLIAEQKKKEGLESLSEEGEIEKYCKEVIKENPKPVEDYKKGEEKALHFLVGKVMRLTKSKATPKEVNEILRRLIK